MKKTIPTSGLILCWVISLTLDLAAAPEWVQQADAFVQKHCSECHDAETKKGGFDLSSLQPDLTDARAFARWIQVHDQVASGEMPPKKHTPPPAA
ncbi:MAG: mono/diheme cytochrome c family protein, partial [Pseudoalteromonas tetraodonis]